ncbi:MAG: hypothetical protein ABIH83_05305 [Candidatus Micrarchaeota archaeon]
MELKKIYVFAFVLLAISAIAFSVQLNISVTDKDSTKLVGTTVQIMEGKTVIEEEVADELGVVRFNLTKGPYFVKLARGSYPEHVVLMVLEGDTATQLIISLHKPTYTLYGKIIDEPADKWEGQKLYLVDIGDSKAAETTVRKKGYYSMDIVWPGERYKLRIGNGEDKKISAPFSYDVAGAYYVEMDLREGGSFTSVAPKMTVPQKGDEGKSINIYLKAGEEPIVGEEINVTTPVGETVIITNEYGAAQIFAAGEGEYLFAWNNLSASTIVGTVYQPPVVEEEEEEEEIEPAPIISQPQKEEEEVKDDTMLFGAGAAGMIVFAAVVLGVFVAGGIAYYLTRKKSRKKKKK